jgi:hypothetical protein
MYFFYFQTTEIQTALKCYLEKWHDIVLDFLCRCVQLLQHDIFIGDMVHISLLEKKELKINILFLVLIFDQKPMS